MLAKFKFFGQKIEITRRVTDLVAAVPVLIDLFAISSGQQENMPSMFHIILSERHLNSKRHEHLHSSEYCLCVFVALFVLNLFQLLLDCCNDEGPDIRGVVDGKLVEPTAGITR